MGPVEMTNNTMSDADAGLSKTALCKKISKKLMDDLGIDRSAESIKSKLYDLIARYKTAADNARNTGEGIREDEGEENFKEFML